ncbi:hypothetical protein Acr_10g0003920 [Actinidia rufa]|uniref:Uncharacterized protein n=1 Tax=Actinidia rufa TaxID=165716 RepID=A0A7J0FAS8_9ERIC|nr:hypothetical protein Acr_10g0003920 [Actinidia rufa]
MREARTSLTLRRASDRPGFGPANLQQGQGSADKPLMSPTEPCDGLISISTSHMVRCREQCLWKQEAWRATERLVEHGGAAHVQIEIKLRSMDQSGGIEDLQGCFHLLSYGKALLVIPKGREKSYDGSQMVLFPRWHNLSSIMDSGGKSWANRFEAMKFKLWLPFTRI